MNKKLLKSFKHSFLVAPSLMTDVRLSIEKNHHQNPHDLPHP